MLKRSMLIAFRLFFGSLALVAVGTQLVIHAQHGFDLVNFFSYFTNLSNIFAAVILLISVVYLAQGRKPTVRNEVLRGTATLCMAIVGIVFSVLLRDVELGHLLPWVNTVLHYIMPVAVVIDWLYQPPKAKFQFRQVWYWLVFPFVYLGYALVRGAVTDFYPYPFLRPETVGGYAGVAAYCAGILATFLLCSWLLMKLGNKLERQADY